MSESNMEPQDLIHVLFTYFSISIEPESGPILEMGGPEFSLATQAYWTLQILWYLMSAHAGSGPGGSLIDKDTLKRSKLFFTMTVPMPTIAWSYQWRWGMSHDSVLLENFETWMILTRLTSFLYGFHGLLIQSSFSGFVFMKF